MKRITIYCPVPGDATSFYRGIGVFAHLRKFLSGVEYDYTTKFTWANLAMTDLVFMQRPFKQEHLDVILEARKMNRPVWVDCDDDLFSVPFSNPAFTIYGNQQTKDIISKCLQAATIVTVSTQCLKNRFSVWNQDVRVIPNAFNPDLVKFPEILDRRQKVVVWRGGAAHDPDLFMVTPALGKLAREFPDWKFAFIGRPFWGAVMAIPDDQRIVIPWQDVIEYHRQLFDLKPAVLVVPLEETNFNKAKSNCAWIEASWAGAYTLCPDWPEWKQPGVWYYDRADNFEIQLRDMMQFFEPSSFCELSRQAVQKSFSLDTVNLLRLSIVKQFLSPGL